MSTIAVRRPTCSPFLSVGRVLLFYSNHRVNMRTEVLLFGLAKEVVHPDFRGLDFVQLTSNKVLISVFSVNIRRSIKYIKKKIKTRQRSF